jgi:hypothetical protein
MIFRSVENTAIIDRDSLNQKSIYTRGLWDASVAELMTFFTSSAQNATSKDYYYEIWSSSSLECSDEQMFSVAYAHISGSGSANVGGNSNDTPSRAIFSQYKLSCLDGDEEGFVIRGSNGFTKTLTDFYVININRSKVGDKLDPGNFEINLAQLSGSTLANNVHTGSNVKLANLPSLITLIDDSNDSTNSFEFSDKTSTAKNIVSGTIANGIHDNTDPHYYGLVYPDRGVIILDAHALNQSSSFNTVTGSQISGDNAYKLFTSISGAASVKNEGFTARAVDIKNQHYVFVRIPNTSFNYSNNPTYVTASQDLSSKGLIREQSFVEYPYTYITTIGLYNDARELIAVGKLSKPVLKSPTSELSITVKLEY